MTATYCWEHNDGNDYEIKINFRVLPGTPTTRDYPGDPAEVDYLSFTCKENPAMAEAFSLAIGDDYKLQTQVDRECYDVAEAMWELSQCDD